MSGWVGTGLLGSVLAWLLWVHLPAKDKQVSDMLDRHAVVVADLQKSSTEERNKEREARHSLVDQYQKAMLQLIEGNAAESKEDRKSFQDRQMRLEDMFHAQITELKIMIQGFYHPTVDKVATSK